MKPRYERGALADLEEIFAYIAADNREAAGRVVARIERVATRIAASPEIGGVTRKREYGRTPQRSAVVPNTIGPCWILHPVPAPHGELGSSRTK
jgi:plasmid stabilization system protein ParE